MIEFFVKRPVTTVMFVLFFVLLGLVAYPTMNVERTPAIDFPMVSTTVVYPGASPKEVEELVVKPIEDAVAEVSEIKKVTSESFENGGFILVEFNIGADVNQKSIEVKDKVEAILNDLPDGVKKPRIEKLNPLQESVLDLVLTSDTISGRDLYEYADQKLKNKLTAVAGVASVKVFGGSERAVRIYLDPEIMNEKYVTILDVSNAMRMYNINFPGGKIDQTTDSINVRFFGEFQTLDDIKNMPIVTAEGKRFFLKDIAVVEDAARRTETGAMYNSQDVVLLSIVKASDGNAVKISSALHKVFPEIQKELPEGMELKITNDSSIAVVDETVSTWEGIILGLLLTIAVLLIFTGSFPATIVSAVVIPASLFSGFFFMNSSGFTINSMTLLAMATALGTLISNAIVIIESSLFLIDRGDNVFDAAITGTKRVVVAVLAATGTNVVVFLPIAFMGGLTGQFMQQFGLSVVYLTLLSLMFSMSLTPMMIRLLFKPKSEQAKQKKSRFISTLTRWSDGMMQSTLDAYEGIYKWLFRHPYLVMILCFVALFGSAKLMKYVGNEFMPSTDVNEISLSVKAPQGSTYTKSAEVAMNIEKKLREFKQVKSVSSQIGDRGIENISIKVELVPIAERSKSDKDLVQEMMPKLAEIVDAEIQVVAGKTMGGTVGDMIINVYGQDQKKMDEYAEQMVQLMNGITEIQSATVASKNPKPEFRFIPDQESMNFYGVSNQQVAATIRYSLFGDDDHVFKQDGVEYPIIIELGDRYKDNPKVFSKIYVNTYKGLVPISSLGKIQIEPGDATIKRRDRNRIVEISVLLGKSTLGPVQAKVTEVLNQNMQFDQGYGYYFAGMSETQSESVGEIAKAFLLATIMTYMILAAILNSLLHPFTIATCIITSFAGVFVMMFLTGASINIAAMLAIVMLVGLAVNNAILVLEPTIQLVAKGGDIQDSLWTMFKEKYRMILMTTIAVMSGMVPQLWSVDQAKVSMGAVIIGGMLGSLVFTFVLVPVLFWKLDVLFHPSHGRKKITDVKKRGRKAKKK